MTDKELLELAKSIMYDHGNDSDFIHVGKELLDFAHAIRDAALEEQQRKPNGRIGQADSHTRFAQ